jgi:hypothetical protein
MDKEDLWIVEHFSELVTNQEEFGQRCPHIPVDPALSALVGVQPEILSRQTKSSSARQSPGDLIKDRQEIHQALKHHRGHLCIHFTGDLPQDTGVLFACPG